MTSRDSDEVTMGTHCSLSSDLSRDESNKENMSCNTMDEELIEYKPGVGWLGLTVSILL